MGQGKSCFPCSHAIFLPCWLDKKVRQLRIIFLPKQTLRLVQSCCLGVCLVKTKGILRYIACQQHPEIGAK